METNFEKLKGEILKRAKAVPACSDEYKLACSAIDEKSLVEVVKRNWQWCWDNKVITFDIMPLFSEEVLKDFQIYYGNNAGNYNAGNRNAGYDNAGNYNAGNRNAGYANAGNDNAGNRNAGYDNAGNYNAGNRNAGYANAGYANAGNDNAGNRNAGNYNAGNRNAGYANAGNDNAGSFNTSEAPYMLFNKPSNWTFDKFKDSRAFYHLQQIDTTQWVPSGVMSNEEKEKYPYHITTGGYVKYIPFKDAFNNAWFNWNEDIRNEFKSLPNFDAQVFEEITGVKI